MRTKRGLPALTPARELKLTLPGPMTIVDTIADAHYGDRVKMAMAFAALLNEEARGLAADGVDVIQFDEPAFNVYMDEATGWGIDALHRAIEGVAATSAVHICYGYGIPANIAWKATLGGEWRQYEKFFPALARSRIDQVSVECINSHVPLSVLKLLDGKDVLIGVIDVATDEVETAEQVAAVIAQVADYVPKEKIIACTNCGMAPMHRDVAVKKLEALAKGAALAREKIFLSRHRSLRERTSINSPTLRRCSPLLPEAIACSTQCATWSARISSSARRNAARAADSWVTMSMQ